MLNSISKKQQHQMAADQPLQPTTAISFCSSLKDDSWLGLSGPHAFESWHFDAVSDDGREALVIGFYDNYALSPRFYTSNGDVAARFPAVSLAYSIDGKSVFNCVNEFAGGEFTSTSGLPDCTIASSSFRVDTADYGSGFVVTVDIRTLRGRRIRAEFEWLLIESDLKPKTTHSDAVWNVAVPRADVSGRITLVGRRGKLRKRIQFRGTGYHDHITSENVHYRELSSRMWGRAHFVDSTVVFERHGGVQDSAASGKLFIIRDGEICELDVACDVGPHRRDRFGLKVPRTITYASDEVILLIEPTSTIRSGFCEVKMLGEVTLEIGDIKRKAAGIIEFINPRRMQNSLFRWISDLRIGRNGRSPLF